MSIDFHLTVVHFDEGDGLIRKSYTAPHVVKLPVSESTQNLLLDFFRAGS